MSILVPVAFAVATWWLATLLMLYRSTRAREKCFTTLVVSSLLAVLAVVALVMTRGSTTVESAYIAFLSGLVLWGWHEMTYFLGYITGPRPKACPEGASSAQRFSFGVKASLYHELGIIACAALLAWLTWGQPNQVAGWTFLVLWLMRWSAKLNIFLGVRNLHPEFWPDHLQYLGTYVRHAPMNRLFPVSMLVTGLVLAAMCVNAFSAEPGSFEQAGLWLLITLVVLAALEHVFLMVRVPDAWLWRLATREQDRTDGGKVVAAAAERQNLKFGSSELGVTQGP